jgi:hypothetical protein
MRWEVSQSSRHCSVVSRPEPLTILLLMIASAGRRWRWLHHGAALLAASAARARAPRSVVAPRAAPQACSAMSGPPRPAAAGQSTPAHLLSHPPQWKSASPAGSWSRSRARHHLRVRVKIMGLIIIRTYLRFPYVFIFSRSHDLHPHRIHTRVVGSRPGELWGLMGVASGPWVCHLDHGLSHLPWSLPAAAIASGGRLQATDSTALLTRWPCARA